MNEQYERATRIVCKKQFTDGYCTINVVITNEYSDYNYGPEIDTLTISKGKVILYQQQLTDESFDMEKVDRLANAILDIQ